MLRRALSTALITAAVGFTAPARLSAQFSPAEYARRRAALVAQLPDGVVLALGGREPAQDYLSFYQQPDFNYLTGFLEPDATLVMVKHADSVSCNLFVQPHDAAREMWTGIRLGVDAVQGRTGMTGRDAGDLRAVVDSLAERHLPFFVVGDFPDDDIGTRLGELTPDQQFVMRLRQRHPKLEVRAVDGVVAQLRARKSAAEAAMIRKAAEITAAAEREAMTAMEPGMNEFELQALIEYTFRRDGADRPSFATIIGSGPDATTLHYNTNDRFIGANDLVVMDVGASYHGYAADVTRSIPASGVYSAEQRSIYQIVRDAQAAAERQASLGAAAHLMSDSATNVLAQGLARLGLIDAPRASYDCAAGTRLGRCPQYTLYYMHGLGHGIGLEVHDPEQYYYTQRIAQGSAFTIEPGIYVRADVLETLPDTPANRALVARLRPAVEKYRDIGVRIEDDYLATSSGVEWISRAPREMSEIEALMKMPWTGPAKRDSALVESYRSATP